MLDRGRSGRAGGSHSGGPGLLPGGRAFRLGSDLSLPATDVETYRRQKETCDALSTGAVVGGTNWVTFIGSAFTLPGPQAALLLGTLPPLIHLKGATGTPGKPGCNRG